MADSNDGKDEEERGRDGGDLAVVLKPDGEHHLPVPTCGHQVKSAVDLVAAGEVLICKVLACKVLACKGLACEIAGDEIEAGKFMVGPILTGGHIWANEEGAMHGSSRHFLELHKLIERRDSTVIDGLRKNLKTETSTKGLRLRAGGRSSV